jgi:hypothetical protein
MTGKHGLVGAIGLFLLVSCGNSAGDESSGESLEFTTLEQGLTVAVDVRVNGSSNDAEESASGSMSLTSTDLELVTDGSRGAQVVGMRFQNVAVPRGATITAATLTFTVDETTSAATSLNIRGQNVDDAPTFTTTSGNLSSRALTTAAVTWAPAAWSTTGQNKVSPSITSVISELTNRSGWASGNDIVVVITGSGSRVAEAYDGVASSAPLLHVEYDSAGSVVCGNATCDMGETCVSCAADCGACATCTDGIQNQGETGLDCGGPCSACGGGTRQPTQQNLLVAFIGDQGNNSNSTAVLQLIQAEGAAAVVHNGDFDYGNNATTWDNRITSVLGANYPYFAVIGNHDASAWGGSSGYAAKIAGRHARNPEMVCTGELGVRANCNFRGLQLIQSCVGTSELRSNCGANSSDQVTFLHDTLAGSNALFKVCSWHKNQHEMQVGSKGNEVGWSAYQECVGAGAIVSTGHEHSYSRTLTLTNVGNSASGHGATGAFDIVNLGPQSSFVFVSGLAGVERRAFQSSHSTDTWWASYYASDRWLMNGVLQSGGSNYGALFVRFYVDGNPNKATAYFKDISGRVADTFTIYAN